MLFRSLHRTGHVLRAGLHTMRHYDFGSNLASVQDGVDVGTFERLAASVAGDPGWQELLRERPRFQLETVDLQGLAELPDGTLGRELLRHLVDHDLLHGERHPDNPYPASEQAEYAKIRWRETHDVRHVLTGVETSVHDEIVLQAFQLGQFFNWFSVTTMLGGPFLSPRDSLRPKMLRDCYTAFDAGRQAKPMFTVYWERLYAQPVSELRERFNVRWIGPRP